MTDSKNKTGEHPKMVATRREFMATTALIATSAVLATSASAQDAATLLGEGEPIALTLGYRSDAATVDLAKYPAKAGDEAAPQLCSNCSLYKRTSETTGACAAIPGRLVAGTGWCSVWNRAR